MCLYYNTSENTVGKGEIAHNEQFLLFPQCFLPSWRAFCHFHQIKNCRLQTLSVWKSCKFVVWERVKDKSTNRSEDIVAKGECIIYVISFASYMILYINNVLTRYHTIQHFDALKIYSCG